MSIIERPDRFAAAVPICAGDKFIGMDATERGKKFANFPIWIFHGDQDELVPIQQSEVFLERMKKVGAECKLVVAAGKEHGWDKPLKNELAQLTGWFDRHLLSVPTE
jgi:predicted peptidase